MKLPSVALLLMVWGIVTSVKASPAAEVERLLANGQATAAQVTLETALKSKPRDPELRFLLGVALTELAKTGEAIQVFTELSQEFPELPDPLNNLAVLHAAQGNLEAARVALETALRNQPKHRAARENLGDVYLHLALRQWQQVADSTAPEPLLSRKLTLVRGLIQQISPARPGSSTRP